MGDLDLTRPNTASVLRRAGLRAALFLLLTCMVALAPRPAAAHDGGGSNRLIVITEVVFENGQLVAIARVGDQTFRIPIALDTTPSQNQNCPILNLEINDIHLNLLGLQVDTSDICLDIMAERGRGLLGNLLCSVARLLDRGLSLGDILERLNPGHRRLFLRALRDLLQGAFDRIFLTSRVTNTQQQPPPACPILHLELGPVNLNLLGLLVQLDNCNNGPVTVDITAVPGPGNLLGNLLCGLANLLNDRLLTPRQALLLLLLVLSEL